ncbi:MAG: replicative DNA helicase [Clostridiales bacterium]|jgi:replicative DNA helicase|nr:replicative DNA helicase [Clostridiales bacterium]
MADNEKNKKTNARTMPCNQEAEQCVLGSCLIDGEIVSDVTAALSVRDFYLASHQKIFGSIEALYNDNKAVDVVTVTDLLDRNGFLSEVGGLDYLVSLSESLPSAANFRYYVNIVKRDSTLRALIKASNNILEDAYDSTNADEALSKAEKLIFDLSRERDRSSLVNINTVTSETIKEIEDLFTNKTSAKGIYSGFKNFDLWFNGLHRSDLILIAARPGVGKTSFALNLVSNVALKENKKVVIFSLEMPIEQLSKRLLCGVGHVSMSDISNGSVGAEVFRRLHAANKEITAADIYVDDSSLNTPADILSKCRRFIKEKGGLDLVMIDYLQLMSSGKRSDNRQQEISELTRSLKIIAKELNVPILLLSQLSRALETRTDHRPMLSDLRESGAIEQDADIVIFIHKPDMYDPNAEKDEVEMIVSKHRNGKTGTIYFEWVGEEVSFRPKLDRVGGSYQSAPQKKSKVGGLTQVQSGDGAEASTTGDMYADFNGEFGKEEKIPEADAFADDYIPPEV